MNTTNTIYDLTPRIMRRIYVIWMWRKFTNPTMLKGAVFVYALGHLSLLVSYYDVWRNTSRIGVTRSPLYLSDAYLRTEHVTQLLIAFAAFTGVWLMYDTARTMRKNGRLLPFIFSR